MNGDSAKRIVAFVGSRWRLLGNHGFDESIDRVVESLRANGYVEEREAKPADRMTFRIETHPLRAPTWEPDSASLTLIGESGHGPRL